MQEIIKSSKLRQRIKLQLKIIAEFFSTDELKLIVVNDKNKIKIFKEKNILSEKPAKAFISKDNIYQKLSEVENYDLKEILAENFSDGLNELLYFKLSIDDYIYLLYFPEQSSNLEAKKESLRLFKKQFKFLLEDIYSDEQRKNDLDQKNRENRLLKKEKYIASSALDSIPGNISILNSEGKIVYTNTSWDRFAAQNNSSPEEVGIGENYLKVVKKAAENGDSTSKKVYQGIMDVLNKDEQCFTLDYPCNSPEEKRWFRMYVSSFKGVGEYEILILHQNITAEILARKNSESLLDQLPGALIKFNEDLKLSYFNKKAKEIFDLEAEDFGRNLNIFKLKSADTADYQQKLKEVLKKEKRIDCRITVEKNKKKYSYANILFPYFNNSSKGVISLIPERSRSILSKNKKVTNHYLQLFNNFPDALVLLNIDEKIINANKKFCQLFGYEMQELKNKKIDDFIVLNPDKNEAKSLSHSVLTGEEINKNVIRVNSQGEKLKLNLRAFPVLLHDNKIGIYAVYKKR